MVMTEYNYVFVIGTFFAMLDAYNNGANDVANAWATSVSSRSVSYRMAMLLALIFEVLGAVTVGARTADTIKNKIIPNSAFEGNAGVQMLAFTCALAGSSSWVMWCTRHSAHVSSTYSLISSVAGVGVAVAGASQVSWGWNGGQGLGAIFAGLGMAPAIAAGFGAVIFMLIKLLVHIRSRPVQSAIYSAPFFFFVAGTICTLSIVYKGSPNLKLNHRPGWWIAAVSLGAGSAVGLCAAVFVVPFLIVRVLRRDGAVRWWMIWRGPLLLRRPLPDGTERAMVPNYEVVQHDEDDPSAITSATKRSADGMMHNKSMSEASHFSAEEQSLQADYHELQAQARERLHAKIRAGRGPLSWAMRTLHETPYHTGEMYELRNLKVLVRRLPPMVVVGLLYGSHYDIHAAQIGIKGTPEGVRMERVYGHATKYPNEVEHTYSFVQVLTACTASFAHGANDVGNAAGPWAVIYATWRTGEATGSKAAVPVWQLAVTALVICAGFITYGYNIMKVMGNKLTYHSPSRGCSMEMGAAITVLLFSQEKLPVSTSMCITGATIGVGLCNGTYKAINWQRVGLLAISWILTIPIAGTLSGVLMAIILNAPHLT